MFLVVFLQSDSPRRQWKYDLEALVHYSLQYGMALITTTRNWLSLSWHSSRLHCDTTLWYPLTSDILFGIFVNNNYKYVWNKNQCLIKTVFDNWCSKHLSVVGSDLRSAQRLAVMSDSLLCQYHIYVALDLWFSQPKAYLIRHNHLTVTSDVLVIRHKSI